MKSENAKVNGPVERAKDEIRKWATREIELTRDKVRKTQELSEAEKNAGLAYLEGRSTGHDQEINLRSELTTIDIALRACRAKRLEAIAAKFQTEAAEMRRQAAEKESELGILQTKTAQSRQLLATLEEVPVESMVLSDSKSQKLSAEISELKARAHNIETQKMPDCGRADLEEQIGTDDLLITALTHESAGPSAQELLDWANACEAQAVKRFHRGFADSARRYFVIWNQGKIDSALSNIFCRSLAPPLPHQVEGSPTTYDVRAATFRAEV